MQRKIMELPKTMGNEKNDTRPALERMGFVIVDDTKHWDSYQVLAPDGWTIEWRGSDGTVINENNESVIWLRKKGAVYEYIIFSLTVCP